MENKYGLGSTKVAQKQHDAKVKATSVKACKFCGHGSLTLCPTLSDHYCEKCGKYQDDLPTGYSTGRSADF
jgi:hypothetical protein